MTRLFRSKSSEFDYNPPPKTIDYDDPVEEKEVFGDNGEMGNRISTPFINSVLREGGNGNQHSNHQFAIVDILVAALRKSLVTCSVEREDVSSMDISYPMNVRHVSHVTFDRFNGFLGLPVELEPEVPRRVPSASVSVFGVSAKSMQCSYDIRGNSVPTILLLMQKRLYLGGLKAEGIFRLNAENSQEEYVRDQLNKGSIPHGIDVHCLAGLIKAWLRELPTGVLDSLTPEQVMHCNSEDDCTQLVKLLPPTEAALLDWAINLMADVAQHEQYNKMNARNVAMVFAPNMTQMVDPLTALIHAVQVMNLLKTLILKTLREREESAAKHRLLSSCPDSPNKTESHVSNEQSLDNCVVGHTTRNFLRTSTLDRLESHTEETLWSLPEKNASQEYKPISSCNTLALNEMGGRRSSEYDNNDWLSLRKGVKKLCRHPVFQLTKLGKKTRDIEIVHSAERGGVLGL